MHLKLKNLELKHTIVSFLVLFILSSSVNSQDKKTVKTNDSFPTYDLQSYSENDFKKVLNREFTSLLNGLPTLSVGNYLSVNQKDSRATLAFSSVLKENGIFSANFSGAAPGGVITLANNSRVTFDFSVGVQYHLFNWSRKRNMNISKLKSIEKALKDLEKKRIKEWGTLDYKKIKASLEKDSTKLNASKSQLEERMAQYNTLAYLKIVEDSLKLRVHQLEITLKEVENFDSSQELKLIKSLRNCPSSECTAKTTVYERKLQTLLNLDKIKKGFEKTKKYLVPVNNINGLVHERLNSYKKKLSEVNKKIVAKAKDLEKLRTEKNDFRYQRININNAYFKKERELRGSKLEAYNVDEFAWVSLGAQLNRNQFQLYDSTLDFENQLSDESFTGGELTIQFSYYNKGSRSVRDVDGNKPKGILHTLSPLYANMGVSMRHRNNLSDLRKITVKEETTIGEIDGVVRTTSKDIIAFTGPYSENLSELFMYGDFYYFFFKNNFAALHWNPNVNIREGQQALWNMDIGLILSFKNSKDKNAIVNTELFFSMKDLTNTTKSDFRLFERNAIGIRLTLPLKFKYKSNGL